MKIRVELEYDVNTGSYSATPLEGFCHQSDRWIPWGELVSINCHSLTTHDVLQSTFITKEGFLKAPKEGYLIVDAEPKTFPPTHYRFKAKIVHHDPEGAVIWKVK